MADSEYLSLKCLQVSLDDSTLSGGIRQDSETNLRCLLQDTAELLFTYVQKEGGLCRKVNVELVDLPGGITRIAMRELYVKTPGRNPLLVFGTAFYNGIRYSVRNPPPEVNEYRAQVFVDSPELDSGADMLDFASHAANMIRQQYGVVHCRKIDFTPLEEMILTRLVWDKDTHSFQTN